MDVGDLCGSPRAVAHWNAFYHHLVAEHGFAEKPAVEAISRGALIAFNWASRNPSKVACIVADIPVCDFKSWPAGKGRGPGDAAEWQKCLRAYDFAEQEALRYRHNPVDNLAPSRRPGCPCCTCTGAAMSWCPSPRTPRSYGAATPISAARSQ